MDATRPAPPRPDGRRDTFVAAACALLVAVTVIVPALVPAPHPSAPTLATFADDPACLEWTDSCVVCTRTQGGRACSTPGIACQVAEPRCLRRKGG